MRLAESISIVLTLSAGIVLASCDFFPFGDGNVDRACTEIGCSNGYTLKIRPSEDRFPAGRYEVSLTPEGDAAQTCHFVVSADGSVAEETCNAIYVLGYDDPDWINVDYPVLENSLDVTVERDGTVVGDSIYVPVYRTIQPNGPGCPPVCRQASDRLILE